MGTPASELLLQAEVERLNARVTELRDQLDQANAENQRLRTRIVDRIITPPTLTTLDQSKHEQHAERYLDLVHQMCRRLARAGCDQTGRDATPAAIAGNISIITRTLFADPGSATDLCLRLGLDPHRHNRDATDLVRTATDLATDAVDWDFHAPIGTRPDPAFQKPWGTCDPTTPVVFVVAPAYRANGRLYANQQVFTQQHAPRANLTNYLIRRQ
ncbi:hypothetical protein BS329_41295 [Amycolatopsis coloradensis]|uniref:Uncharacterized protein n=1 Tax=Amycolatopsis coloradensis TaxID=76021 RepID=A0A1R0KD49_9PSEU|nr:cell division protein ZapB [Amycolatopsis coloradensis]OLZ42846.1 hypothetical protein BS329_41295 [Amycolatopsis coloradensis]